MKKIIITAIAIIVISFSAWAAYTYIKQSKFANSPTYAINQIEQAIEKKDVITFQKYVNTPTVSQSMLEQLLKDDTGTPEKKDNSLMGRLSSLGNTLTKRFENYIQPELQRSLEEQMNTFVSTGYFSKKTGTASIYAQTPLLEKVWNDFAAEGVIYKGVSNVELQNETTATAIATFYRADIDYNAPIQLTLEKQIDIWRLVKINNLSGVLNRITVLEEKFLAEKNHKIEEEINQNINITDFKKSSGVSQWGIGQGVLLALSFENIGSENISHIRAQITFKNKKGEILRRVKIEDSDVLNAGEISEKSWPMPINPLNPTDESIYQASADSLIIEPRITSIQFESGKTLSLIDTKN